jgi:hypothetical protein
MFCLAFLELSLFLGSSKFVFPTIKGSPIKARISHATQYLVVLCKCLCFVIVLRDSLSFTKSLRESKRKEKEVTDLVPSWAIGEGQSERMGDI